MMKRILIVWGVALCLGACSQVPVVSDVHVNPDKSLTINPVCDGTQRFDGDPVHAGVYP